MWCERVPGVVRAVGRARHAPRDAAPTGARERNAHSSKNSSVDSQTFAIITVELLVAAPCPPMAGMVLDGTPALLETNELMNQAMARSTKKGKIRGSCSR